MRNPNAGRWHRTATLVRSGHAWAWWAVRWVWWLIARKLAADLHYRYAVWRYDLACRWDQQRSHRLHHRMWAHYQRTGRIMITRE